MDLCQKVHRKSVSADPLVSSSLQSMATCTKQQKLSVCSTTDQISPWLKQSANWQARTCLHLRLKLLPVLALLARLFVSAVPFLLFLAAYGINGFLRFLPTFDQAASGKVTLHNVTRWETIAVSHLLFGRRSTPIHQLVSSAHCLAFDLLAAVPYLAHYTLPVVCPLLTAVVLRRHDRARRFYLMLGMTMWTFYAIWYFLPTAPPWYQEYVVTLSAEDGRQPDATDPLQEALAWTATPSSATSNSVDRRLHREGAAFARLDRLFGVTFFRSMFAGNPVPFGAFPSGHIAWPTCFVVTLPAAAIGARRRLFLGGGYVLLVTWATLYSGHHFVADAVAAVAVVLVVDRVMTFFRLAPDSTDAVLAPSTATAARRCREDDFGHCLHLPQVFAKRCSEYQLLPMKYSSNVRDVYLLIERDAV